MQAVSIVPTLFSELIWSQGLTPAVHGEDHKKLKELHVNCCCHQREQGIPGVLYHDTELLIGQESTIICYLPTEHPVLSLHSVAVYGTEYKFQSLWASQGPSPDPWPQPC